MGPFALPYPMGQVIKSDCSESSVQRFEAQNYRITESEPKEKEVEADNSGGPHNSNETSDIGLLSSLLPPMHNPNIEATPVQQNEDYLSDHNSMNENEMIKMANAIVRQEFVLPQVFKEVVEESKDQQLVHNPSKVINQSNDY